MPDNNEKKFEQKSQSGVARRMRDTRTLAKVIRRRALEMVHNAGIGHPGGDLSAADILSVLYFGFLRHKATEPDWPGRDIFILSKGHASAAFYCVLAEAGYFDRCELDSYAQPGSRLGGHPYNVTLPGVEASTGPLGHGLPIAVGLALAARLDRADRRVVVLVGDGELQEGSNWEAAMFAAHRQLSNLLVIVDRNYLQQGAATEGTNALEPLAEKWRAFGWSVHDVDGHDHSGLTHILANSALETEKPSCLIARTIKGKGVSFMEGKPAWHHRVPNASELATALFEIGT